MRQTKAVLAEHALGIDHVAVVVPDLEASVAFYRDLLGFEVSARHETRGQRTGMVSAVVTGGPTTFVLVQGTEPDSQVSRFLGECGPGVQHVAVRVRDLPAAVEALEAAGVEFEMPMIESPFTRQMFTIRDARIGVRIELIERKSEGFDPRSVEALFRAMEANGTW